MVKHVFVVCLCLFMPISAYAVNDGSQWAKAFQGLLVVSSLEQTFDGGFVATSGDRFIRLDSSGQLQWAKRYSAGADMALQTSDGGFVFVGVAAVRDLDAVVVKLDAAGNILWQKAYGSSSSDEPTAILQAADGGFFLLGLSTRSNYNHTQLWCMKLSAEGSILWQKTYGNNVNSNWLISAVATNDGGMVFVGTTGKYNLPWVVRLDQKGGIRWQKQFHLERATSITATADGGFVVGGWSSQPGVRLTGWALKLDANGALQWQTGFQPGFQKDSQDSNYPYVVVSAVRQEKDGHILVMGTVRESEDHSEIWTARLDSNGKMFWQKAFGQSGATTFLLVAIHDTPDDGTVFTATRYRNSTTGDVVVARTASNGMVCGAFRGSLQVSNYDISLKSEATRVGSRKNTFAMRTIHVTQAPVHIKVTDLCAGK